MSSGNRKKISLAVLIILLAVEAGLIFLTFKNYTHTIPVVVGPYRQFFLLLTGLLASAAAGFYFQPFTFNTIAGTICIILSACWFSAKNILTARGPVSALPDLMDHWMVLPLVLFGIGSALWIGSFLPETRKRLLRSEKWHLVLVLLIMFIILEPALSGGFCWDDAFFSVEAQSMRLTGESIFRRVWKEIIDYVRIGRINPFATFHFLVFYFIPDVRIYKLLLVVLSLLNGWLFYRFVKLWSRDHFTAILSLILVLFTFQFRIYHDPLNSYYGLMQVMFCEIMGALITFIHWLREGKKRSLILSLLCFGMALMSYEMTFPLTALFLIPAWTEEKNIKNTVRRVLPWICLALLIFVLSMLLRGNITEETAYNGTTFGLDIPVILRTFASQVGAAFPLSYRNAGQDTGLFGELIPWSEIFNTSLPVFLRMIRWQDLLICLIFSLILFGIPAERRKFSLPGLLFGALLWLLPGLVISLSTKYQNDLVPGIAYIPVYFSCFGMGMMLYELCCLTGNVFNTRTYRTVLAGAGCMILLISMQDSRHICSMLNDIFLYPREAGEQALQAGILGESSPELVISAVPYSLWEHGWIREPYQSDFYSLNARKSIKAVGESDFTDQFRAEKPFWVQPSGTLLITYSGDEQGGFAKSGKLTGTGFDFETNKLDNPMVSDVYLYVSGKNRIGAVLTYWTRNAEWKQMTLDEAWLIRQTPEGTLYKLQEKVPILFDTIGLLNH